MTKLIIIKATKGDLPAILDVQKKTFLEVARTFHLKSLPAIEQTLESLVEEFEHGIILKALLSNTSVIKNGPTNGYITDPSGLLDSRLRGNDYVDDDENVIIVGSVRAYQKDDTCYIGRLVVLPEYQNQGIGKALMREIENQYKNRVKRYALFTGESDPRNRYLYDQLGYKPYKTKKLDDEITMVYLEKRA